MLAPLLIHLQHPMYTHMLSCSTTDALPRPFPSPNPSRHAQGAALQPRLPHCLPGRVAELQQGLRGGVALSQAPAWLDTCMRAVDLGWVSMCGFNSWPLCPRLVTSTLNQPCPHRRRALCAPGRSQQAPTSADQCQLASLHASQVCRGLARLDQIPAGADASKYITPPAQQSCTWAAVLLRIQLLWPPSSSLWLKCQLFPLT
jgi:hypothetical protein